MKTSRLTPMQKVEYQWYVRACRRAKIKPSLVAFLTMDVPWSVADHMAELEMEVWRAARGRAMAAVAGR